MSKAVLGTWDGKDMGIRHHRYMGWSKDVQGCPWDMGWEGQGIRHQYRYMGWSKDVQGCPWDMEWEGQGDRTV